MAFPAYKVASQKIDSERTKLADVSHELWTHPELLFKEFYAHDLLTKTLTEYGFKVEPKYTIPTAFKAEFSVGNGGPTACVMLEYDALPEVGHACGHNLIAESGLAAALGIKAAMEANPSVPAKLLVLGTPAEEGGGGKIILIRNGAFKDVDFSMMVHPSPVDHVFTPFISCTRFIIKFKGKASHAAGYPWEGKNALDAAVACYNNISMMRQQMLPNCRIHGVITKGGVVPNIIPDDTELKYMIRALRDCDLKDLHKRFENCIHAAALATGCEVSIECLDNGYNSLITNKCLGELYGKYAGELGVKFSDGDPRVIPFIASSDVGNVSHVVPSIQPCYSINTKAPNHSIDFANAAGAATAQESTIIAAKAMAGATLEILHNPALLKEMKKQFEEDLKS